MKITDLGSVETVTMNMEGAKDVLKQIPISAADGSPSHSVRVFTILPGGHTPYHGHAFEHLNYVIDGTGVVRTESGEERPIGRGDFVLVAPNEVHQYRNTSREGNLVLICAVPKEHE